MPRNFSDWLWVLNSFQDALGLQLNKKYFSRWWSAQWEGLQKHLLGLGLGAWHMLLSEVAAAKQKEAQQLEEIPEHREFHCCTAMGVLAVLTRWPKTLKGADGERAANLLSDFISFVLPLS